MRAFYHMRQEANPEMTKSFDLLWKGLEVTTGAQREQEQADARDQHHLMAPVELVSLARGKAQRHIGIGCR